MPLFWPVTTMYGPSMFCHWLKRLNLLVSPFLFFVCNLTLIKYMVPGQHGRHGLSVLSLVAREDGKHSIVTVPIHQLKTGARSVLVKVSIIWLARELNFSFFKFIKYFNSAPVECPDCSRKCKTGTLSSDCTRCTCEDHIITGYIRDEQNNPIAGASIYKYGHYDLVAQTDRVGRYRFVSGFFQTI